MPRLPSSIEFLVKSRPALVLETSEQGDLFSPESWGALFSSDDDRQWRYALWRVWDQTLPTYIALMLNPSTADHLANDPTVDGICKRARQGGYGAVIVINAFAWRATDPGDMKKAKDPIGQDNDHVITTVITEPKSFLLCAWGQHVSHLKRGEQLRCLIKTSGITPHCLKLTKSGEPGHPLYIAHAITPVNLEID